MNMRILIIGDSTVLYQDQYNILPDDTFGFIIKKHFKLKGKHEVLIIGNIRNYVLDHCRPIRILFDITQFDPDVVIISLGSSDCSLHVFPMEKNNLFFPVPKITRKRFFRIFIKLMYHYKRGFRKFKVNLTKFQFYYQKLIAEIQKIGAIPIIINIPKPDQNYLKRANIRLDDIINLNIILYNIAKIKNFNLVDIYSLNEKDEKDPNLRMNSGFYLSKYGHKKIAEILISEINSLINN